MTPRQRYIETLTFGNPDRIPFQPGEPRESTLAAWRCQGMPPDADYRSALLDALGLPPDPPQSGASLDVSFRMIPEFEEKVIEHRAGHYVLQDWMGAIVEIPDRYDHSYLRRSRDFVTRKWHKFPVASRADWERMKERYHPRAPGRFPDDFDDCCRRLQHRDHLVGVMLNGPFWQLREWCGFEGLCLLMADDPGFVDEMSAFWADFVLQTITPILERVQLDYLMIGEDMAFKDHSMISPDMVRRFLRPVYQRWIPAARAAGCPIVDMDCDGYVADLIPLWIEAGFNCTFPIEVAAGNDIVEFRRRFGARIAYRGGLDKRALARGGDVMRAEVMRVVPPLLHDGGLIPGCDHAVPPDISWPDYVECSRLLAQLTGWL